MRFRDAMAACVVIGFEHSSQTGSRGPRFGIRTRRMGLYSRLTIATILSCFAGTAAAEGTGYTLYLQCSDAQDRTQNPAAHSRDTVRCLDYLGGFVEGVFAASGGGRTWFACFPSEGVALGQIRLIFNRWALAHSNQLHVPASAALLDALSDAFPCR
jgi:hypothetical protein